MRCKTDLSQLQACLDGELDAFAKIELENHLQQCASCRQKLQQLKETQNLVNEKLTTYLDTLNTTGNALAWQRLNDTLSEPVKVPFWKGAKNMFVKRGIAAAAAIVVAAGVSLSFAPVRSAAANFLSIFRVEKMQTVNLSSADLNQIAKAVRQGSGMVKLGDLGQFQYMKNGTGGKISLAQAKEAVDFSLRQPSYLPAGFQLSSIDKAPGGSMSFSLDTTKTNRVIQGLGSTKLLPPQLNGQTFTVDVPAVISLTYGGADKFTLSQARTPELTAPGNASVNAIRDALLALPVLPPDLRNQLASINDWQHTFLVPNIDGSSQQVKVDGTQGVFISRPTSLRRETPVTNALVWENSGIVYALTGHFSQAEALEIANSLH